MSFNSTEESDGINEINITPFVDVVLVLLVIFMVTAPVMLKESLKVKLPKTLTSDLAKKNASVGIAVTKEGQTLINGELVEAEGFDNRLKDYAKSDPSTQFLISADADSRHGDVVKVIDRLKANGLESFALQVEKIKVAP
jgi:biopolymer transport protein ExbD